MNKTNDKNIPPSLAEVIEWKDKASAQISDMGAEQIVEYFRMKTTDTLNQSGFSIVSEPEGAYLVKSKK